MEKHLSHAEVFGKNIFPVQPYTLVEKNEPSVFFFARLLKRRLKRREKKGIKKKINFLSILKQQVLLLTSSVTVISS